jgi:formate-dependent nitrite reductase membrane component NrfD
MSWGSWILLFAMFVLFLRLLTHVPEPPQGTTNRFVRALRAIWRFVASIGHGLARWNRAWDVLALILGAGLGLYTGILLNTIPARPLWNSSILPFLFLASGLASGCAFLCLFIPHSQVRRLVPISLAIGGVELALILSYVLTLTTGAGAMQRAAALLLSGGPFAVAFWVVVVLVGLLLPVALESAELAWKRTPRFAARMAPILTLIGGITLRFVVVYAGLQSFL